MLNLLICSKLFNLYKKSTVLLLRLCSDMVVDKLVVFQIPSKAYVCTQLLCSICSILSVQLIHVIFGNVLGRPPKSRLCTWCSESRQQLKYILPTQHGKKEFCSETCLSEFRKAYNKVILRLGLVIAIKIFKLNSDSKGFYLVLVQRMHLLQKVV